MSRFNSSGAQAPKAEVVAARWVRALAIHLVGWVLLGAAFAGAFASGHWWPVALFGVALVAWESLAMWHFWRREPRGFRLPPPKA